MASINPNKINQFDFLKNDVYFEANENSEQIWIINQIIERYDDKVDLNEMNRFNDT